MPRRLIPVRERFERRIVPEPNSGCWLWIGQVNWAGYGVFNDRVLGMSMGAHRWAWLIYRGALPDGLVLDHKCRVRCCVNPDHLEAVTSAENNRRSNSPSAHNGRKSACLRGHPLNGRNLYVTPNGRRQCRICRNESCRTYSHRKTTESRHAV